ncbi:hypothetical protein SAMN05216360_1294 [Methylobacterium phyllostachyos]|uniref:Uncharacterized protein n=1 Tax=Methylobacterium phyllostachyos TaxID=582672 RepID=A0A1H0KT87_9HYPH|nr:hypothetical protein [Methylobacterium phyllostachyos]SDO59065.1 hypothetical protein SAMN05216360_1294 [Methylobacterium phyllostachyos]
MIARTLAPDDRLWALDHSTRRYRVRETQAGDSPHVRDPDHFITIVPVNGAAVTVMAPRCGLFPQPWEDSDRYASARLNAISMAGAARAGVKRPDPDAVRLGHDFGSWCVELLRGDRLARRISCGSRAAACAEVARHAAAGLRRLPDAPSALSHGGRA